MAFTSAFFLFCFLPLAFGLVLAASLLGRGARNLALLAASLVFAAWSDGPLVFVLVASALANWRLGLSLESAGGATKGRLLAVGVVANLAVLAYFKYARFLASIVGLALPESLLPGRMPLGVSFFTFAAVAYLTDVYRGKTKAEPSLLDFSTFMALFPKLAAGPIARWSDETGGAADALKGPRRSFQEMTEDLAEGARRCVIGLGKKTLLATPLAAAADGAFRISGPDAATAWTGVVCYGLQLYFDFSGYTDMALGLGRMLGFRLPENFDYPYVSQSVREFWRRWHMSLSSWFRDYLYIPLGGARVAPALVYRNLFAVFVLCGLWHGASWTFVVWGAWHGLFLALERAGLGDAVERLPRPLRHGYALLAVFGGWVFFRAESLPQAWDWLAAMADLGGLWTWTTFDYYRMTFVNRQLLAVVALGALAATPAARRLFAGQVESPALQLAGAAALLAVLALSAMQLAASAYSPFIYATF